MSYKKINTLLFIIVMLVCGCRKKSDLTLVEINKIDLSKIAGIKTWHGEYEYTCWLCSPRRDTSYNITDTFGWVYINDSTIAKQNKHFYGFDTFTRWSVNDTTITFSNHSGGKNWEELTYYFNRGNMIYRYEWSTSGDRGVGELYTP